MKNTDTRQLQFWNPSKRVYEPSAHQGNLDPDAVRSFACGRAWRIAKADRPLKPARYVTRVPTGSGRSVDQVQRQYLDWAAAKGLRTVTIWAKHWTEHMVRATIAGKFKVQPDILAVTPDYFDVREDRIEAESTVVPYVDVAMISEYGMTQKLSNSVRVF